MVNSGFRDKYVVIRYVFSKVIYTYTAVCLPQECEKGQLEVYAQGYVQNLESSAEFSQISIPKEESVPMTYLRIMGFILMSMYFLIIIMGLVTHYTPLFNTKSTDKEGKGI